MSARKEILTELFERLETINTSNGYNTEAGQLVYLGEAPVQGLGDVDASLGVVVLEDIPGTQGENVVVRLPIEIQATIKAVDVSRPWETIEDVLEDIKRAVERTQDGVPDHDFDGLLIRRGLERGSTRTLPRESGSLYVGVAVGYTLVYGEGWGTP